jgi:hypothetical protein
MASGMAGTPTQDQYGTVRPERVARGDQQGWVTDVNRTTTGPAAVALPETRDRVRWGPIWAGLITTLPMFLVLELLAYGIGLGSTSGVVNAWVTGILVLVAFLIGGWVTGRSSSVRGSGAGLVNGFLVWALGVVLIFAVTLLGAGQIFGALGTAFGGGTGTGGVTGVNIAHTARTAAWGGFLSLVASALAAMLGSWLGSLGRPFGRLYRER